MKPANDDIEYWSGIQKTTKKVDEHNRSDVTLPVWDAIRKENEAKAGEEVSPPVLYPPLV